MERTPTAYYSTGFLVGNGSTGIIVKSFGFDSHWTQIRNLGSAIIYANLRGDLGFATTQDIPIKASDGPLLIEQVKLTDVAFYTTDTGVGQAVTLTGCDQPD